MLEYYSRSSRIRTNLNKSSYSTAEPPANLIQATHQYNATRNSSEVLIANIVNLRKKNNMAQIIESIREGINQAKLRLEKRFANFSDIQRARLEEWALGRLDPKGRRKYKKFEEFVGVLRCLQNAVAFGVGGFHVKVEPFPREYIESVEFSQIKKRLISYMKQIHFDLCDNPFHIIFDSKDLSYELFSVKASVTKIYQVLRIFQSSIAPNDQVVVVDIPQLSDLQTSYSPELDLCFSYFVVKLSFIEMHIKNRDFDIKKFKIVTDRKSELSVEEVPPKEKATEEVLTHSSSRETLSSQESFSQITPLSELPSCEEHLLTLTGSSSTCCPHSNKIPIIGAIPRGFRSDLDLYSNNPQEDMSRHCFDCYPTWDAADTKQRRKLIFTKIVDGSIYFVEVLLVLLPLLFLARFVIYFIYWVLGKAFSELN